MGSYFKKLRIAAGFSQRDLAGKLGWSTPQFVSNIEREKAYYPTDKILVLEKLFGVPKEEMIKATLKFRQKRLAEEYAPFLGDQ